MMNAFDALAENYDAEFTERPIGRWLRAQVHKRLCALLSSEDRVLELGCGTGEDAVYLAQKGWSITATDYSEQMLRETRRKAAGQANLSLRLLDLNHLPAEWPEEQYQAVFSNFGVLNCVQDRTGLARWLAQRIMPGGFAAFGIMAPYCIWEMLWHGIHLNPGVAFRRFRKQQFQPASALRSLQVDYPSVTRVRREFSPYFSVSRVMPLGFWLPPSDIFGIVERRPRWMYALMQLEECSSRLSFLANFSDHYWIEFQRNAAT